MAVEWLTLKDYTDRVEAEQQAKGWRWLWGGDGTALLHAKLQQKVVETGLGKGGGEGVTAVIADVPVRGGSICTLRVMWEASADPSQTPTVALHGFGGGLALWCLNAVALAKTSPSGTAYILDLPGFGRNPRCSVAGQDADDAEQWFLEHLEGWRRAVLGGNRPVTLVGHSFGAYLSASYALRYPAMVRRLFMVDAWGVTPRSEEVAARQKKRVPWWAQSLVGHAERSGPLFLLRTSFGRSAIARFRPDIGGELHRADPARLSSSEIYDYIVACNAPSPPTGELHFMRMHLPFAFAKNPLASRILDLPSTIPVHFIYGERTFMDIPFARDLAQQLPNPTSFHVIAGAGHQVCLEQPKRFNDALASAMNGS